MQRSIIDKALGGEKTNKKFLLNVQEKVFKQIKGKMREQKEFKILKMRSYIKIIVSFCSLGQCYSSLLGNYFLSF